MSTRTEADTKLAERMRRFASLAVACVVAIAVGCEQTPTQPETSHTPDIEARSPSMSSAAATSSNAAFKTWHQGFQHGSEGWYGAETPGELGWCGSIDQVRRGEGSTAPSAGRGYAVVSQGACNEHWSDMFRLMDGTELHGAPWTPGPGFSTIANPWPEDGYVRELDIYLDPSWTANPLESGTYVFEPGADALQNTTVFSYSVSFFAFSETPPGFKYVQVPVAPGSGKLLVGNDEYPVTEAGWYTFRHVFSAGGDGNLQIQFELEARRGGTLHTEDVTSLYYQPGSSPSDFAVSEVGTGYTWFTSISPGLELPIDEYRVRRGR